MGSRTLVVIRHAKSSYPMGVGDLERPLSQRGRRDAPQVGHWLRTHGLRVPRAFISPAVRTQQTWALIAAQFEPLPVHTVDDRIYAASQGTLLRVVRELPPDLELTALVGHNPGVEELTMELAGPGSDADAVAAVEEKYPTAAVAVLQIDGNWAQAGPRTSTLTHFAAPRG